PLWPTTEPHRFESLRALVRIAARNRGLCVAPLRAQGRAADGRPVLSLPQVELDWIAAVEQIARPAPLSAAPVLEICRSTLRALVTPSDTAVEAWHHAGRLIAVV